VDLSNLRRTLRPARIAPVDPLEKIAELRRRHLNSLPRDARGPDELSRLKPLGVQRHAHAVMPKKFHEIAPAPAEAEDLARMRVTAE
jgi:hypothetical protein